MSLSKQWASRRDGLGQVRDGVLAATLVERIARAIAPAVKPNFMQCLWETYRHLSVAKDLERSGSRAVVASRRCRQYEHAKQGLLHHSQVSCAYS